MDPISNRRRSSSSLTPLWQPLLGAFLVGLGIILGLYVGLWWAFIGGIITIIEQVRAVVMDPMEVALGIARVMGAGVLGFISAMLLVLPGWALLNK